MPLKNLGVIALAALAVVQLAFLALRREPARAAATLSAPHFIANGDTLVELQGRDSTGKHIALWPAQASWTVVLAFRSDCGWCTRLAPEWSAWLQRAHAARLVAVTSDTGSDGFVYAHAKDWNVNVLAVSEIPETSLSARVVARTPWVFLVDSAGVVRYQGKGTTVDTVDKLIDASTIALTVDHPKARDAR